MDFARDGMLDGLSGAERADRERLLTRLLDDGFSPEALRTAVRENRLALLPVEQVLGGTYTAQDVAERSGLPVGEVLRLRRLHGLPEPSPSDRVFSDEDVEAARSIRLFRESGFDEQQIAEISRVLGEGLARLSATIAAAFVETFLHPGDSEADVALRFADLAQRLTPATAPILVAGFRAHLRDGVSRGMLGQAELEAGGMAGAQELAVCFADVVGFTRLGAELEVHELGTVAGRLAALSASLAAPPVRMVKTIGDAAMFVSSEPAPLVELALRLVGAFEAEDLPSLRAGLASGPALMRGGDYYGNSVNLASRVTGAARPGSVLCTPEIRDATRDRFQWSSAGRHRLKGVPGHPPLYRARSGDEGSET